VIAAVVLLAVILVAYRSRTRGKPYAQDTANYGYYGEEPPQFFGDYLEEENLGLGFIPDEEPEVSFYPEEEISFTPDNYEMDQEISFLPESEEVLFDISEEYELGFQAMENIRCPRCKGSFDADISNLIQCPHCGFSASFKG
jgi:hypothetical protein